MGGWVWLRRVGTSPGLDPAVATSFVGRGPCSTFADDAVTSFLGDGCPLPAHSQRVAKVNPTPMNAMPTKRFFWPRSLKTGMLDMSLLNT